MSNENEPNPVDAATLDDYANDLDTMEDRETVRAIAFELRRRRAEEAKAKEKAPTVEVGGAAVSPRRMLDELIETLVVVAKGMFSPATSISIEAVTFREGLVARVTHQFDERWPIGFDSQWVAIVDITTQWKHENNRMLRLARLIDVIRDYRECVVNARAMGSLPPIRIGKVEGKEPERPVVTSTHPKRMRFTFTVEGVAKTVYGDGPWDIGSGEVVDIRLHDEGVAPQHAQVFVDKQGAVRVRDIAPSSLGLYITKVYYAANGMARTGYSTGQESDPISSGSIVEIGRARVTVEFEREP